MCKYTTLPAASNGTIRRSHDCSVVISLRRRDENVHRSFLRIPTSQSPSPSFPFHVTSPVAAFRPSSLHRGQWVGRLSSLGALSSHRIQRLAVHTYLLTARDAHMHPGVSRQRTVQATQIKKDWGGNDPVEERGRDGQREHPAGRGRGARGGPVADQSSRSESVSLGKAPRYSQDSLRYR